MDHVAFHAADRGPAVAGMAAYCSAVLPLFAGAPPLLPQWAELRGKIKGFLLAAQSEGPADEQELREDVLQWWLGTGTRDAPAQGGWDAVQARLGAFLRGERMQGAGQPEQQRQPTLPAPEALQQPVASGPEEPLVNGEAPDVPDFEMAAPIAPSPARQEPAAPAAGPPAAVSSSPPAKIGAKRSVPTDSGPGDGSPAKRRRAAPISAAPSSTRRTRAAAPPPDPFESEEPGKTIKGRVPKGSMSVPLGWMRFNLSDAAAGAQVDWDLLKDLGLADRKGNDKPTAKTKSLPVSLAWHLPPAVRRTSQRVWELVVVRAPQTDGKPSAYQLLDTDSEALARCSVDRLEGHNVGQTLRARHEAGYVRLAGVLRTLDGDLVLDVGVVVTEKAFIYGDDKEDDGNLTLKMVPDGEHQMLVLAEEILHNDPFGSLAAGDEADAYYTSTPFRKSAKLENILAKEADPHKRWQLSRDKFNILESVLPPADSPQASQPAGLVPSTKLRPHQLKTLKWMVDMEDYDNHPDADVLHPAWLPLNVSNAKWAAGLHSDKAAVPMPEGETTLYIHEVTGTVTTKRFTAFRPERGGILADEMGLGKTLLVIALILSNPDCEDRKIDLDRLSDASYVPAVKTTLVVVPNEQLLDQWLGEFAKHAPQLRVKRHDKKITAIGKAWTIEHKKKYLQELATYDVVVAQFKNTDSAELCSVQFLRLVTDEAHEVRKESATTLRIQGIGSWSSWIVTGTPLVTGVADLLGYCTFLGLHPFMDGTVFNDCILQRFRKAGEGDDEGLERVRGLLSKIMRRYTKDDVKAELATPPMASENLMIELRARERWCYDRLRRALSEFLARAEAKANGATRLPRKPGMTVRNAVQDLKKHASLSVTAAGRPRIRIPEDDIFQTMTEANILENAVPYARSGRLTEVKKNGIEVPEKCDDCQTESDAMVVTFCCLNARNCAPCYVKCLKEQGEQKKCPLCRAPAGKDRAAILIHDEALEGLGSVHGNAPEEDDELVVRFGSKILGTVRDMASRFNADASAKAIVFSHFPEVLADMKDALELMGIQSVLYGSGHAAAVALQSIRHDGNVRVLLMPMRERVVAGLTLTCCNLVYLMEPPLAAAIAAQAANRVDRDGQTRQPITINVLAANTIDENVVAYRALVPPTESATSLNIRGWKMLIDGHGM